MSTVRDALAEQLASAGTRPSDAPAAVLWPDPDGHWEAAVASLRSTIPLLTLGAYEPAESTGPAIWIRAALADSDAIELAGDALKPDDGCPWVIYLPGIARSDMRDLGDLDKALEPLAGLALRSVWWPSAPGQTAWTPHLFLSSKHGLGLDMSASGETKTTVVRVLEKLLDEDVEDLRHKGHLDAARLNELLVDDVVRTLLRWMNDEKATRNGMSDAEWDSFVAMCRKTYDFHPVKDGVLTAAKRLGTRDRAWVDVWPRFADSPRKYPNIGPLLDQARPAPDLLSDNDPYPDSWPSWNREQEDHLRTKLASLEASQSLGEVWEAVTELADAHRARINSVWGQLGDARLAGAVCRLVELADAAASGPSRSDCKALVSWYSAEGYLVDDLAIRALAAVRSAADKRAVAGVLHHLYDPWVDKTARALQEARADYRSDVGLNVDAGTCVVFVDALRYDLGQRLARMLTTASATVEPRLAAFPTVTPTGQPAVAPVDAHWVGGTGFDAADDQGRSIKGPVLRSALADANVQYLDWKDAELGDPAGVAWTQTNKIDALGHDHGHDLVDMLDGQLRAIAERIRALLDSGWPRVVVVTDHGFLLPALPAQKVELPLAFTENDGTRKQRAARLKANAHQPDFPTMPWTWDSDVTMVTAPGSAAFEANVTYTHGGLSLQESVIPMITVTDRDPQSQDGAAARIDAVRWKGQRCRIDFSPEDASVTAEIRLAPGDGDTAVAGPKKPTEPGEVKVVVIEDDAAPGTGAHVVLLDSTGQVVAQRETTIGGE